MKIPCSYHPKEEARWFCPSCKTMHCDDCSSKKTVGDYSPTKDLRFCRNCSYPLESKFSAPKIAPMWKRLPSILAYPIKPSPFVLMLMLTVLDFMAFKLTEYGFAVTVVLWAIWLKYSISALYRTSEGDMIPPDIQSESATGEMDMFLKQMLLLYPIGIVGYFIYRHSGTAAATAYFILMAFVLPAMLTVLVVKDSLIKALNLILAVRVATGIGAPYIFMCVFVAGLVGGLSYFSMQAFEFVPEDRFVFLAVMLSNYLMLLIYHMIGSMIYRHQEELEYETVYNRDSDLQIETVHIMPSIRGLYNKANQLIKEGHIEEAAGLLKDNVKSIHDSPEVSERLYNLLKMLRQKDQQLFNAPVYLKHLYIDDRTDKLVDVYMDCVYINKDFVPEKDVTLKVANTLVLKSRYGEAVRLLERFAVTHPEDDTAPKAYLQAAEITLANTRNREKAVELLRTIVSTFPLHEITPYARKKLKDLGEQEALHVVF